MSEYQYYEWQTIDRLLTDAEQEAVSRLSSHIEVTASQAIVTYNWSDFKHDPRQVLARYFDAHLYFANWGTRILMFRFPPGLLDEDALAPYLVDDLITVSSGAKTPILPHLIQSAATASPAQAPKLLEAALRRAVGTLPRAEADDFLVRLLGGEAGLAHALRRRLQAELQAPPRVAGGGRTVESLLAAAEQLKRDEAQQKAAAAEQRRIADLEKLAQTEEQAWQTVDALLAEKRWKAHEQAVAQLQQLRDLADYQNTRALFNRRVKLLRAKHQSRAALMKRFDRAHLP